MSGSTMAGKSIADEVPAGVDLCEIGLSFTLPMGKNLSRTWSRELRTELESRLKLKVSKDRFELSCNPPILIDAQWPAMNMQLGGATIRFADAHVEVWVSSISGLTEGLIDFSGDAKKEIAALLQSGIEGTAMAAPGYDPMRDTEVLATLEAIGDNFKKQPSGGESDVSIDDLGDPTVEVTLAMREGFVHEAEGAGLALPAGAAITVRATGSGKLSSISAPGSNADRIRAAKLRSISIVSEALSIIHGGQPIASLDRVRIDRGGAVTLERMRLHGVLEEASSLESLVRVVASAARLTGLGVPIEGGIQVAARSPENAAEIVPGLVREKIESALADGVRKLVAEYRAAVPGLDLQEIMGT